MDRVYKLILKKVKLPYGRKSIEIALPDNTTVIEEKYVTGIKDETNY